MSSRRRRRGSPRSGARTPGLDEIGCRHQMAPADAGVVRACGGFDVSDGRCCEHCGAPVGPRDRVCFSCQRAVAPAPASIGPTPGAGRLQASFAQALGPTVPPEPVFYEVQRPSSRLVRFLRTGWTCPGCGKGGVPSDKFCTKCGTPIQAIRPEPTEPRRASRPRPTCATCANLLGPMDAFCSRCGSRR